MKHLLRTVWTDFRKDPVKALLTIVGVAVGVAIVTLTVNVGNALRAANGSGFPSGGVRMIVGTAVRDGRDGLRYDQGIFALSDMEAIRRLVPSVKAITPVAGLRVTPQDGVDFGTVSAGDYRYQVRRVSAVGADYALIYGLHMTAGTFFTTSDMEEGRRVISLSETTARILFGSVEDAVGKLVGAVQMPDRNRIDYTVTGVYRDVPPALAERYDIGDLLVPLALPPKYLDAFAVLMDGPGTEEAAALLTAAVHSLHGRDVHVLSWEGNRWSYGNQQSGSEEVQSVTLFLDAFGALALIIASTGILTMMMVGVVERTRSIGLRRALGSRRIGIMAWFVGEALMLTGVGALLGIAAAAAAGGAAMGALAPMLPGKDDGLIVSAALRLDSIVAGAVSALLAGAIFSLPPAIVAARVQPSESMRDA